jgi:hypothetical protein
MVTNAAFLEIPLVVTGGGHCGLLYLENASQLLRVFRILNSYLPVTTTGPGPERAKVATRVHDTGLYSSFLKHSDRVVNSVTLGDASQVEPYIIPLGAALPGQDPFIARFVKGMFDLPRGGKVGIVPAKPPQVDNLTQGRVEGPRCGSGNIHGCFKDPGKVSLDLSSFSLSYLKKRRTLF